MFYNADLITIDPVIRPIFKEKDILVYVLRLDKCDPVVSGNKWFKLRFYLEEAIKSNKKTIVTYGGPWSNHLVATAAASKKMGLKSLGYVRGEKPALFSHTLNSALSLGMELQFLSRDAYATQRRKVELQPTNYVIPEGGYGMLGAKGASTITDLFNEEDFTHVLAAVGTGTMLAGIANALKNTTLIGIPVLKGKEALEKEVSSLLMQVSCPWSMLEGFEWGGYAKHPAQLLEYMNQLYNSTKIPTDIVYTSKLFYAVEQLATNNFFKKGSRLLLIHSGGLQGNESLEKGALCFSNGVE
jgi:1-aminocyclopropane-1-carboxylate deaminase/D-cysteine desulfhydrase-like pyridoxal-dependent ACC family enzyme